MLIPFRSLVGASSSFESYFECTPRVGMQIEDLDFDPTCRLCIYVYLYIGDHAFDA